MDEKKVICSYCGREVYESDLNRDGECNWCRAADKASDMTVGDLNRK